MAKVNWAKVKSKTIIEYRAIWGRTDPLWHKAKFIYYDEHKDFVVLERLDETICVMKSSECRLDKSL